MEEKEAIEILSKELIKKIETKPEECISILKTELLGEQTNSITYEEYLHHLQKTLKKCACQASWNNKISISCLDCQKSKNSCICVNCFLKGNHQGHRVFISHSTGTCDCGDLLSWSPSGFCSDHPGPESNPEQTQLTKETRIKLISICKASLSNYIVYANTNSPLFTQITDFLQNLVSIGDATKRCVSLAIKDTFSIYELYTNSIKLETSQMEKLIDFISSLLNDRIFGDFFSLSFVSDLPKFIQFNGSLINMDKTIREVANQFYYIGFHTTILTTISPLIQRNAFNWSDVFKKSFELLLELIFAKPSMEYLNGTMFFYSINRLCQILQPALKLFDSKSSEIIELIDQIASILIKYESCFTFTRMFGYKYDDPAKTQDAVFQIIFYINRIIKYVIKKNILTKKPLFLLENFFKGEQFQSIDKSYKSIDDFHFRSVLDENVGLSQCFTTHFLAFHSVNYRDRKSFTETLREVTDNAEKFMRDWAVIPLRFMAAADLMKFGFFVRNSDDTIINLNSLKYRENILILFTPTFSLIQQLLKATENVDDFLLMIISTFGFFNSVRNEEEDNKRKLDENENRNLLLAIYNFVLCLIFDTVCIERNFFMMWKLSAISRLMKEDLPINQITSFWYKDINYFEKYCDELNNFASRVVTKKETKFHLKDSSGWHPLLPFMELNLIIPLVQKFIDKNPDSLINFPSIPDDSIHLLFSPTLWALHYYILSNDCIKGKHQVIHQYVLNTLIVTSQNCDQLYKDKNNQESNKNSVLKVEDFNDFIIQLKKFTFNDFMTVKIGLSKSGNEPKSMVDLISEIGNVGITVLTRMNLSNVDENSFEKNQQKKEEMKKKNQEKVKQLKMQIMNNFSKKQKLFKRTPSLQENQVEDDKDEVENSIKIECNICHLENSEDCFVYPALIYNNSLQSYFKWRFRNAQIGRELDDDFSEVPKCFPSFHCVRICLHPIHSKCIHSNIFLCPSDRCSRNSSIPILDSKFDEKTELEQGVFNQAENFLKKAYYNNCRFALYSLASQIEILEMRQRSNLECLDDVLIQPTLRNIYLCIWHVMKKDAGDVIQNEMNRDYTRLSNDESQYLPNNVEKNRENIKFTPLMFYIASFLIELNVELDSFASDNFILNFKNDLNNDYKWLQFLRCVAIFDHFARGCKIDKQTTNNEFIDWDAILSPTNLCKHYNIHNAFNKNEIRSNINNNNDSNANNSDSNNNDDDSDTNNEMTLPMFSFINLPKNFLDFIHPPFSAPILESNNTEYFLCLLTGKVVVRSGSSSDFSKYTRLATHIQENFDKSFTISMRLNGNEASRVVINNIEFDRMYDILPFYTDKFGDSDIGMNRGSLLYLNKTRIEEIIDVILSGYWTNFIQLK